MAEFKMVAVTFPPYHELSSRLHIYHVRIMRRDLRKYMWVYKMRISFKLTLR